MNKNGTGGINMRGGINPEYPLTQEQLNEVRLQSAMNIMRVVESCEGGERVAENAWNTIMNIACGDGTQERKPFDKADHDIFAAARAAGFPNAALTEQVHAPTSQEPGTRFTISGGEVMELDSHLEARYEEMTDADPF